LIKGIGPKLAGELVDRFGVKTLEIIERQPKRLREVPGIGRARAQQITDAWRESRDIREIGLLLEKAGAPRHLVLRVRQRFAEQAADVVGTSNGVAECSDRPSHRRRSPAAGRRRGRSGAAARGVAAHAEPAAEVGHTALRWKR
jgi:exodeoxyribonuclease V alpha subunit